MHDLIIHAHALLVPILTLYLVYTIGTSELTKLNWLGIASVGLSNGASGIITAHELGHRKPKSFSWYMARVDLLCVLYLHFTTEHNYTHHKHWAREVDPTSSKFGQSIYGHFIRTVPKQIKGAYKTKSGIKHIVHNMQYKQTYNTNLQGNCLSSTSSFLLQFLHKRSSSASIYHPNLCFPLSPEGVRKNTCR